MILILWAFIVLAAAMAACLLLVCPARTSEALRASFRGLYAHRGFHDRALGIPENSLGAFALAAEHGYGIEMDVQLSADGQVVVFHDDTLERMCGLAQRVDALPYENLRGLSLLGTSYTIPLFAEVLSLVNGRVPFIIEIKHGRRNPELCAKVLTLLGGYKGLFCIESFNPFIVRFIRKHAPHILRGQLSCSFNDEAGPRIQRFILHNLLFNIFSRPHFIAYRHEDRWDFSFALVRRLFRVMTAAWTVKDKATELAVQEFDMIIFEQYDPAKHREVKG